jgi:hypothetical protein
MIHAFALEPELVATWGNKSDYRYFFDKFGLGTPRVALGYPRVHKWKRRVLRAAESVGDMELQRVTALVSILAERMAKFAPAQLLDGNITWLEYAEQERISLIIARTNPRNNPNVIIGSTLGDVAESRWDLPQGKPVARKAQVMAGVVSSLLSNCSEVVFVDPHLGFENPRHQRPFRAFFKAIVDGRNHPITRVAVMTSSAIVRFSFFKSECEEKLPGMIPSGLAVSLLRLNDAECPEKLHNRYILTDIGGVQFATGLDDGKDGETDDVTILSRDQYELRWAQYASENPIFKIMDEPVVISGTI